MTREYDPATMTLVEGGGGSTPGAVRTLKFTIAFDTPGILPVDEVQSVSITGAPTGGTFKLAWEGGETADLAFDIDAATLQTEIDALLAAISSPGTITVGGANPDFTLTFPGEYLGHFDVSLFTLSDNSLTGGTAPDVAIAEDTKGNGGLPVYTPVAGEWLVDAWFDVLTPWDQIAYADVGMFASASDPAANPGGGIVRGLFFGMNGQVDMAFDQSSATAAWGLGIADVSTNVSLVGSAASASVRLDKCRFLSTDPLCVVVSDDGRPLGADPGASVGEATLVIQVCAPDDITP